MSEGQALLQAEGVVHRYPGPTGPVTALDGLSLSVARGEWVAVAGPNGSGKSTLARVLGGLLPYQDGAIWLEGERLTPEAHHLRSRVGLVFQDPENQVVGSTVEEDVAFGPENLGLPTEEIARRVDAALNAVGLVGLRHRATRALSGGQRQLLAIAGALALEPDLLILDEPTAMLDASGQDAVLSAVLHANRERGVAVLWMTHRMEEALAADRLVILQHGRVAAQGPPCAVLAGRLGPLECWHLSPPAVTRVVKALRERGIPVPEEAVTIEAVAGAVLQAWRARGVGR
ncbi:MAG TPA: ATP-binding cassette domain-containing protein [Limnochorda sp.]